MEKRKFGKTGLEVSCLSFGSAEIGFQCKLPSEVEGLVNSILDLGISLIDTAVCYGKGEELLGQTISHRRDEYVLVSKCGHHGITVEDTGRWVKQFNEGDPEEWTAELINISVRKSLKRLKTDHLDCLLLHSCTSEQLGNEKMIEELIKCKQKGMTRFIGYSGDAESLAAALKMDVFDCIETSVNICDQQVVAESLPAAKKLNIGVISKRTVANVCWMEKAKDNDYAKIYRERFEKMGLSTESVGFDGSMLELALRFTLYQDGVSSAIIGGRNLEHVKSNIKIAEQGPLPADVTKQIRNIWLEHDDGSWVGQI